MLACPGCGKLVHSEALKQLSRQAEEAGHSGDCAAAIGHWREALELLPPSSRQYTAIAKRVEELSKQLPGGQIAATGSSQPSSSNASGHNKTLAGGLGAAGGIALLLWKFKFIAVLLASKAKLLLLGFTKLGTLATMAASLGVYWAQWGWKFALGLVISIYVHEMGHVAALRQYGIKAGAPMFIPGLGAFVRLKQMPLNARQDARIGLAGPIWGTAAALVCLAIGHAMRWPAWIAIAHVGAWINLFNLLPIWQLDGSRGFRSLDRGSRILLMVLVAFLWRFTGEGLLVLILIVGGLRALAERTTAEPDTTATVQFAALLTVLALVCMYSPKLF